ncbi:MAG: 16S rRNA (uracil(1498)-N(3))-methyltransferase [Chloroflexi bacterium]|nr:16S rRNA (uracil(1498)-N(3))-methyltransferase [Chloroflexota bacterium]
MTRHRFFIPPENFSEQTVVLPSNVQDQIIKVLRLGAGDWVELLDNRGGAVLAALERDASGGLIARVLEVVPVNTEPQTFLTLYFGLTQREKLEWILQKGTEIGVCAFQPFVSKRTLVRDRDSALKKRERWEGILREAAEQSGRGRIPELRDPLDLTRSVEQSLKQNDLTLACWVHEKQQGLDEVLSGKEIAGIGLFTGPEGGFAPEEAEMMLTLGVQMVSLGPRVLRMETAAILAPALVLYQLGEMRALKE